MNTLMGLLNTIAAMGRIVIGLNPRGQTVNNWARLVIVVFVAGVVVPIVIWPFVLLGASAADWYFGTIWVTAAAALLPLAALPVFLIAVALALPLLSGGLVLIPGIRTFLGWLTVAVFVELVVGLYFAVVHVWNDPRLIPLLILLVVVLGMFLILKRQFGWQGRAVRWFAAALVLGIAVITAIFFVGGRDEIRRRAEGARQQIVSQTARAEKEFTLNAGEQVSAIYIEEGVRYDACSNQRWRMGRQSVHEIPAGCLCITGPGRVWATGLEDGTVLRFQRRRS